MEGVSQIVDMHLNFYWFFYSSEMKKKRWYFFYVWMTMFEVDSPALVHGRAAMNCIYKLVQPEARFGGQQEY